MKKNICMILCLVWSFMMTGCLGNDKGTAMNIYYLDPEGHALVQEEYFRKAENKEAAVEEVLEILQHPEDIKDFQSSIPSTVKIKKFRLNEQILELTFNEEYMELNRSAEVLLRASVVQAQKLLLCQKFIWECNRNDVHRGLCTEYRFFFKILSGDRSEAVFCG